MAFVRQRTTKAGGVSTTLVESYRDAAGKPRQRVLANLYGCAAPLEALAKLAAQRQELRKEKVEAEPELKEAEEFYRIVMTAQLEGRKFSIVERKEIDPLLRKRKRLLKRDEKVASLLARIQKDGTVIRKHCGASQAEIQVAIREHRKALERAEKLVIGSELMAEQAKQAKRDLRRLSLGSTEDKYKDIVRFGRKFLREQGGG